MKLALGVIGVLAAWTLVAVAAMLLDDWATRRNNARLVAELDRRPKGLLQ
jgi:hypothetical protein